MVKEDTEWFVKVSYPKSLVPDGAKRFTLGNHNSRFVESFDGDDSEAGQTQCDKYACDNIEAAGRFSNYACRELKKWRDSKSNIGDQFLVRLIGSFKGQIGSAENQ